MLSFLEVHDPILIKPHCLPLVNIHRASNSRLNRWASEHTHSEIPGGCIRTKDPWSVKARSFNCCSVLMAPLLHHSNLRIVIQSNGFKAKGLIFTTTTSSVVRHSVISRYKL